MVEEILLQALTEDLAVVVVVMQVILVELIMEKEQAAKDIQVDLVAEYKMVLVLILLVAVEAAVPVVLD